MTKRVIGWFSTVVRSPQSQPEVHFHQGPNATPMVCFDDGCGSPRLEL
jgi:hypothetical protein